MAHDVSFGTPNIDTAMRMVAMAILKARQKNSAQDTPAPGRGFRLKIVPKTGEPTETELTGLLGLLFKLKQAGVNHVGYIPGQSIASQFHILRSTARKINNEMVAGKSPATAEAKALAPKMNPSYVMAVYHDALLLLGMGLITGAMVLKPSTPQELHELAREVAKARAQLDKKPEPTPRQKMEMKRITFAREIETTLFEAGLATLAIFALASERDGRPEYVFARRDDEEEAADEEPEGLPAFHPGHHLDHFPTKNLHHHHYGGLKDFAAPQPSGAKKQVREPHRHDLHPHHHHFLSEDIGGES